VGVCIYVTGCIKWFQIRNQLLKRFPILVDTLSPQCHAPNFKLMLMLLSRHFQQLIISSCL